MHLGRPSVNWETAGILALFKHISGANPASYLSLLVNSQPKLAEMVNQTGDIFVPLDAQNLKNSHAVEWTTDISGM